MIICWLILVVPLALARDIVVNTSRGAVKGFDHDFGSNRSSAFYGYGQVFLGIPFAEAPVGALRFALPRDICRYNDRVEAHDATYYRPRCYQTFDRLQPAATNMSEDCLYLNVVTPDVTGKYPVMVYIHGGSMTTGGADIYHWKGTIRNLVSRGVVVVTIQYRLGLLGFFTTYTESFPPNRGLYDQILALRWVREEIGGFGGDPDQVAIFGQSAGAVAVSYLSMTPHAEGLFHRLAQTSGSALLEIETVEDPRGSVHQERARQICQIDAANWGTPEKDAQVMGCLLKADPAQLVAFDFSSVKMWNPSIDGALLPTDFWGAVASRKQYPVLMGDTLDEFAFFLPGLSNNDLSFMGPNSSMQMMAGTFPHLSSKDLVRINDILVRVFGDGKVPAASDRLGWAKLTSDIWTGMAFDANMVQDVRWHQAVGNDQIWLFTFAHAHKFSMPIEVEGWIPVDHCAELPFVWFYPEVWGNASVAPSEADFAVAEHMGSMFTDFAKTGKLNFPTAGDDRNYIEITAKLTNKNEWRMRAENAQREVNKVFGEWPPLSLSERSKEQLNELGKRVLSKWNSISCPKNAVAMSSSSASALVLITRLILIKCCA